jgi:hypothetical protein
MVREWMGHCRHGPLIGSKVAVVEAEVSPADDNDPVVPGLTQCVYD